MEDELPEAISLFAWMAWTQPTALFFVGIGTIILIMTVYEIKRPCAQRKGFLPIATTRGDRLFISLLTSAFLHLIVLGATDWSIWIALAISIFLLLITLRWG
ncbi:MAG: putative small integral membrane protein [Glaciecola sp.]|jgi:predicted small integral membrane protein